MGKFNINSLFPLTAASSSPPSSPSSSHHNSKPGSPNNNSNNNLLQPSLEKMLDSPIEAARSPVNGAHPGGRQSPGSERSVVSPGSDDTSHAVVTPGDDNAAPETKSPPEEPQAKPAGGNALASLMSFCDDQQTKSSKRPGTKGSDVVSTSVSSSGSPMSDPGAILAFSWAVNQAGNSTDSAIKCPFCDTPFISKGAYRHHLSKMHFTKENLGNISAPHIPQGPLNQSGVSNRTPSPEAKDAEESLQSK